MKASWQKNRDSNLKAVTDFKSTNTTLHLDPQALIGELQDKRGKLWEVHAAYEKASKEYVEAHCVWKLARAKAYLVSQGTQAQREAYRDEQTAEEMRTEQIAEALKEAMHQRMMTLRLELQVLQSILSIQKVEWQMTGEPHM